MGFLTALSLAIVGKGTLTFAGLLFMTFFAPFFGIGMAWPGLLIYILVSSRLFIAQAFSLKNSLLLTAGCAAFNTGLLFLMAPRVSSEVGLISFYAGLGSFIALFFHRRLLRRVS